MIERVILGAILVAALLAAALLFRRSYRRGRMGGGCAGCPMADQCASFNQSRLNATPRKPGDTESENRLNGASSELDGADEGERV